MAQELFPLAPLAGPPIPTAEALAPDWRKATWFYARFGVTEGEYRSGAPAYL